MGAGFSKVFNQCPLRINCTASWVHPETKDQHIILGADQGVYTLNLNEIHEGAMDLVSFHHLSTLKRKHVWCHFRNRKAHAKLVPTRDYMST